MLKKPFLKRDLKRNSSVKIAKICAIFVILIALAVIIGWIANISFLKTIIPGGPSMKMSSAFLIILSGLNLYIVSCTFNKHKKVIWGRFSLILSLMVLVSILALIFLTSFEDYPSSESDFNLLDSSRLGTLERFSLFGVPSIATILSLILFNFAILTKNNGSKNSSHILTLGILILIISVVTTLNRLFGLFMQIPYAPFWETGMAIHTAFCFFLLSLGIISVRA